ncbi:MAG TPA: DUF1080 domain-containing protein [Tepidisphaeraceae bacterium]|jgi:hypothetical protein|nr:DUF1080 domain-containing protein [Tepidisphaeraceae bacterium]
MGPNVSKWAVVAAAMGLMIGGMGCTHHSMGSEKMMGGGFKPLFNGKDLSGWDGDAKFWSVEDGAIVGRTTKETPAPHNTFLIYKGGVKGLPPAMLGDFELKFSFKLTDHNSGMQYRSKELPDFVMMGYQADIAEGQPSPYTGMLYEERGRGIVDKRGQKVVIDAAGKKTVEVFADETASGNEIDMSKWNDYEIIAKGDHIIQKVNGKVTVDFTDDEVGKSAREGLLGLQIHAGKPMMVEFKNIRLKVLQ